MLILAGGIVRSTGAGMGCPDWPKCFGSWIPPTSEEQLPADYKEYYVKYRHEKNIRFASYLDAIGFNGKASQILNEESVLAETEFNKVKTWTEYINRLTGALIGIFVIVNLIASFRLIRTHKKLFFYSLLLFLAVVFEGWIGSIVVSTNLVPWVITLHMLLAMAIVAILLYLIYQSRKDIFENKFSFTPRPYIRVFFILSFILLAVQVLLGTQVREAIDMIASSLNFGSRALWISGTGVSFLVHRSFSIIVILSQVLIIYYLIRQPNKPSGLITVMMILLVCTLLEVFLGAVMAYFHIPAFIQPAHLLIGVVVFGIQFLLVLVISDNKSINKPSLA